MHFNALTFLFFLVIIMTRKDEGMAYRTHQINKKNGVTYVYDVVSKWHKELGQARNKQVCVGKLDSVTGEFIPSKRLDPQQAAVRDPAVTASAQVVQSL